MNAEPLKNKKHYPHTSMNECFTKKDVTEAVNWLKNQIMKERDELDIWCDNCNAKATFDNDGGLKCPDCNSRRFGSWEDLGENKGFEKVLELIDEAFADVINEGAGGKT